MFSLSKMVMEEKTGLGGAIDIASPLPLIYSFNNLSMPFPAQWLQVLKMPLSKHQHCWYIRFCSKPKVLNIPRDQRHRLGSSDGQMMKPESKLGESARRSEVGVCTDALSPLALSWSHSCQHSGTAFEVSPRDFLWHTSERTGFGVMC